MNFVDKVDLTLSSGKGGDGLMHFRREKYRPKGGPDGGDGGNGGSIMIAADRDKQTLAHLTSTPLIKARNGDDGQVNLKTGKGGEDVTIHVPLGTQIIVGDKVLADLTQKNDVFIIAKGGKGGRGNWHFKSATNQTPRRSEPGQPGEQLRAQFQLKLIADFGLVGQPNAGKSSLINALTRAESKVGAYPFTTIQPYLGMVKSGNYERIIADIPGIIAGASKGKGLGLEFLSHIERTKALLICVPADSDDPVVEWQEVVTELQTFNKAMVDKPLITVITKTDLVSEKALSKIRSKLSAKIKTPLIATSSQTNQGLTELVKELQKSES